MEGKRERLRKGEVVELEPGIKGRLNSETKRLELSDGRNLAISKKDKQYLFPENEEVRKHAEQKEKIEREIKASPFGEFGHQFSQHGIVGGVRDWSNRLTKSGEDYIRHKLASKEIAEEISEESPWTSRAAHVASWIPDIALTKGAGTAATGALMSLGSAGSRILDEPFQVGKEALTAAGASYLLGKGFQGLGKVASRRAASRAIPGKQAAVRAANAAEQQAVNARNSGLGKKYNLARQQVEAENASKLMQYEQALQNAKTPGSQGFATIPQAPNLSPKPAYMTPETFLAQPEPILPRPEGLADYAGDLLEKPLLGGTKGAVNSFTKLAGLKYLLGKAALPIEGAYLAAKGITSPEIGGQVARMTFKQGGLQFIQQMAQKYPSYENGVLQNPQDRRSLTREIEDNHEIPIEQKAILQSKINRGKPLDQKL